MNIPMTEVMTWGGLGPQDFLTKPQLSLKGNRVLMELLGG